MVHIKINQIKVHVLIVQEDSCVNMTQQSNQLWMCLKTAPLVIIVQQKLQLLSDVLLEHFHLKVDFNQLLNVRNVLLENIVMECLLQMRQQVSVLQAIIVSKVLLFKILQTVKQVMFVQLLIIVRLELTIHYPVQKEHMDFQL